MAQRCAQSNQTLYIHSLAHAKVWDVTALRSESITPAQVSLQAEPAFTSNNQGRASFEYSEATFNLSSSYLPQGIVSDTDSFLTSAAPSSDLARTSSPP